MPKPKAYEPEPGYKYQILCRNPSYDRAWKHCDYAVDRQERLHLLAETSLAYGVGWEFRSILLPTKYWPSSIKRVERRRYAVAEPHGLCVRAKRCLEHEQDPNIQSCKLET